MWHVLLARDTVRITGNVLTDLMHSSTEAVSSEGLEEEEDCCSPWPLNTGLRPRNLWGPQHITLPEPCMILTVNMMLNHQLQETVNASRSVCEGREKETEERPIRGGVGELVQRIGYLLHRCEDWLAFRALAPTEKAGGCGIPPAAHALVEAEKGHPVGKLAS